MQEMATEEDLPMPELAMQESGGNHIAPSNR